MAELLRRMDLLSNSVSMLRAEVTEQERKIEDMASSRESESDVSRKKSSKGKSKHSRVEVEKERQLKLVQDKLKKAPEREASDSSTSS